MEKFYGEVFSRLQKHIKTIEKKTRCVDVHADYFGGN